MKKIMYLSLLAISLLGCSKVDKSTPTEVVEKYLSAKSVEERFEYVCQDSETYELMKERYSEAEFPVQYESIRQISSEGTLPVQVTVSFRKGEDVSPIYYVVSTEQGFRIDWKSSIFYSPFDPPATVIDKFTLTRDPSEKYKYLFPTKGLKEKYEKRSNFGFFYYTPKKSERLRINHAGKMQDSDVELVLLEGDDNNVAVVYQLKKGDNGYQILWEPTTLYNPINFVSLKALTPEQSYELYVFVELSDYFNYEYLSAKSTHISLRLSDPHTKKYVNGYLDRDSKYLESVIDILSDGKKHLMIMNIQYNENPESSSILRINEVINTNPLKKYIGE